MTDTPDAASLRENIVSFLIGFAAEHEQASLRRDYTKGDFFAFVEREAGAILALLSQEPEEAAIEQPDAPGAFVGDIWFGHPIRRTFGTHRWNGTAWDELPSEIDSVVELLAATQSRASKAEAERDELRGLLETTRDYLLELSENQLRNDIDMRLDPIKDPELVASDITATLAKGDGA